jgi:rhodanese-related sulfurtransferase
MGQVAYPKNGDILKEKVVLATQLSDRTLEVPEGNFLKNLGIFTIRAMVIPIAEIMGVAMPLVEIMLTSIGPRFVTAVINPMEAIAYWFLEPILKFSVGKTVIDVEAETVYEAIKSGKEMRIADVRAPREFEQYHIKEAVNVPFQDVPEMLESGVLDKGTPILFVCKSGFRSYFSTMLALTYGYEYPLNLHHGMDGGWLRVDLPVIYDINQ